MRKAVLALSLIFALAQLRAQNPEGSPARSAYRSAGPREDISVLAGDMLKATNQARVDIKNHNGSAALKDVDRAQSYLQQVEARSHGNTMIPVYQEFVSVSILSPIQAEQRARKQSQSGSVASVSNNNAAVHQVAGEYTSVVVNTTVAKNSFSAAKKALQAGDLRTADSALQDVQEGVQITMTQADLPLTRVRENLILARSFARKSDWTEAQNALAAAAHALKEYENENTAHEQAAAELEQQIDTYTHNLAQNHADILAKINTWWNETADWTPYKLQPAS